MHILTLSSTRRILVVLFTLTLLLTALSAAALSALQPVYLIGVDGSTPAAAAANPGNYVLSGYRWNKDTVTFSIANCPATLDCEAAHGAVRESVAAWNAVIGLNLVEVPADGDIVISWGLTGYGGRHAFDGKGGKVAQTYYPYTGGAVWFDGDIVLDDSETWVVGTPAPFPQEVHLATVVTHELGHALGLAHSYNRGALMWTTYTGVQGLSEHDIAGGQALYGAPAVQ